LTYWPGVELGVSRQENELVFIPSRENFILLVLVQELALPLLFLSGHFHVICSSFFFYFSLTFGIFTVVFLYVYLRSNCVLCVKITDMRFSNPSLYSQTFQVNLTYSWKQGSMFYNNFYVKYVFY
jgi:hypothetical protein